MKKLAMILAALMLLSLLPMAAFAAEGTTVYLSPNDNWLQSNARFAVYYFGGADGEGWVSMTADGAYYTATVPSDATIIFCRMNPDAADNNWDNKWNQTSDLPLPTDGSNCYTVEPGSWDRGNGAWSVKGTDPGFTPVEDYYCVAGTEGLCGVNWDASATNPNKMTLNADGKYEITFEDIAPGTYEFKVSLNNWASSWGDPTSANGNYWLTLETDYDVTIRFDPATSTIEVVGLQVGPLPEPVEPTYYVAGVAALCGEEWACAAEANKLALNADGLYEILYTDVKAGSYEFKVTNGTWDRSWGTDGQNYQLYVPQDGEVRILFNAENGEITVQTPSAPTGDNSFVYGFVALMAVSAAAVVLLAKKKAI